MFVSQGLSAMTIPWVATTEINTRQRRPGHGGYHEKREECSRPLMTQWRVAVGFVFEVGSVKWTNPKHTLVATLVAT